MRKRTTHDIAKIIVKILFVLTPLMSAALFCLKDGHSISDVYIPLGGWSDEITYYKEIEGILSHGMPRGYFGYNQTSAIYGSLNVWGIIPLIPYVIFGFFFGWNYCSPIYANILFCIIAFAIFMCLVRPKKVQAIIIALFWVFNQFMNRYVLSGVVEASVFAQLLFVASCGQYLLSDKVRSDETRIFTAKKDAIVLFVMVVVISLLTLARPYFAVLFLIPWWKAFVDKRKILIGSLPIITIVVLVLFFANNHFFCSTYFSNVLSFDKIVAGGIVGFVSVLVNGIIDVLKLIWYAVRYHDTLGWNYLLLFVEWMVMLGTCVLRWMRREKAPVLFITTLIGNVLILVSLIELYSMGVGARHILALLMCNMFVLATELSLVYSPVFVLICVVSLFLTNENDKIPYVDPNYALYMEELEETFLRVIEISDEISYDNVVAMPTADKRVDNPTQSVCTYYGLMFAMPSGVGISLDFESFYGEPENLKAGYIMVHPEGQIRLMLENMGMQCVYMNHELAVYRR